MKNQEQQSNDTGKLSTRVLTSPPATGKHATSAEEEYREEMEPVGYDFGLKRRTFVQLLGTGLLVAVGAPAIAQRRGGRGGGGSVRIESRVHLGKDGSINVLTGKVEGGQGARTELTQAAAEELGVSADKVTLVMADTDVVPNDGITAGSRSTPSTVPAVRNGAAAVRDLLIAFAAKRWGVAPETILVREGKAVAGARRELGYAEFASEAEAVKAMSGTVPEEVKLTAVEQWRVLGNSVPRPNARGLVTGEHKFPSDMRRPGMFYGKVLRPETYGARLVSVDLSATKELKDAVVTRDEEFVGVAAPSSFQARQALEALAKTARWEKRDHPSSKEVFEYLQKQVEGGIPANPYAEEVKNAKKSLSHTYEVAYVQHAPLEPRAAMAEWEGDKLTVWLGTQNPFGCRSELARAFHISEEKVRVHVPDFGSGFGGKHTGEVGIEAARLARAAKRPVSLVWTREEEFTWAYFRPAAWIQAEASLDDKGQISSWHFLNVNSGGAAVESPYRIAKQRSRYIPCRAPLRQGSYRGLAAPANTFARECMMDELAALAGMDPLAFRLAHLENPRLRAVLETAVERFGWKERFAKKSPDKGVGLACGTEKGSYVATCAEVEIERRAGDGAVLPQIKVTRLCEVFECGAVLNPRNLRAQVEGQIMMGLGPALREEIQFENGEILNASFRKYRVPRFSDMPELDVHLLDRKDLASAGGGETPMIAIAPAVANAVWHATGVRCRSMPIRLARG